MHYSFYLSLFCAIFFLLFCVVSPDAGSGYSLFFYYFIFSLLESGKPSRFSFVFRGAKRVCFFVFLALASLHFFFYFFFLAEHVFSRYFLGYKFYPGLVLSTANIFSYRGKPCIIIYYGRNVGRTFSVKFFDELPSTSNKLRKLTADRCNTL